MLFLPVVAALLAQDTTDPGPGDTRSNDHTHAQGQAQRQAHSESHADTHPHEEASADSPSASGSEHADPPPPPPRPTLIYYTGQMVMFGGRWCPLGTVPADGTAYPMDEVRLMYALIGTRFGGDGVTTAAVPDMRTRTPLGAQGYRQPATGGAAYQNVQIPLHSHQLYAAQRGPELADPTGALLPNYENIPQAPTPYVSDSIVHSTAPMATQSVSEAQQVISGDGPAQQPSPPGSISLYQPYFSIQFCFVPNGVFPPRN